jgi:hypothetical protein
MEKSVSIFFSIEAIHRTPPGLLELTDTDKYELLYFLRRNDGSKDCIRTLRVWILDRAHSAASVAVVIREFVYELQKSSDSFPKLLHTVYVLNDVFFNASSATNSGPYTIGIIHPGHEQKVDVLACMWPYIPAILRVCYAADTKEASSKDKVTRLIDLWHTKGICSEMMKEALLRDVLSQREPPVSSGPALTKPLGVIPSSLPPPPPPPLPPLPPVPKESPQEHVSTIIPKTTSSISTKIAMDMHKISIGNMANLLRQSYKSNNTKYFPLDPIQISTCIPPAIEPGRLEARVNDFYSKYPDSCK